MAIAKELWTAMILEGLIPDTSFLNESKDLSEFVEYNKLNLAEAGVDPDVLIDNTIFPVPFAQREDIPKELVLHTFDTKNTVVRNIEEKESSYNKMESVVRSHKGALLKKESTYAAYNWCPGEDGIYTPVLTTGGATNRAGVKSLTFDDLLDIEAKYRALDVDMNNLVAVLNAQHLADLRAQDIKLYKQILSDNKVFSFKLYSYNNLPYFDTTTKKKKAMGATPGVNDTQSSLFYLKDEVCRAVGDTEVFAKYKDPEQRGDVVGFQQRFTALSMRGKYMGAIYSAKP